MQSTKLNQRIATERPITMKKILLVSVLFLILSGAFAFSAHTVKNTDSAMAQTNSKHLGICSIVSLAIGCGLLVGLVVESRKRTVHAVGLLGTGYCSIRHMTGDTRWFVATIENKVGQRFEFGIVRDVTFIPRAEVIKEVVCGESRISEAEAIGALTILDGRAVMPDDAVTTCRLGYDPKKHVFHERGNLKKVITQADYLLLSPDGEAWVGWKN